MDDHEILQQSGALAGLSILAANCRVILLSERYSAIGAVRASVLALFAGLVCGFFLQDTALDYYWKLGAVCIVGVLAEDLLRALLRVGKEMTGRPLEFLIAVLKGRG